MKGTKVKFRFKQTGFNAHTAVGEFTYNTPENAKKAAERMKATPGYSHVKVE